jgi:hypothetical protein
MAKTKDAAPERKPHDKAGLSADQENALLAIEMAMSEMKAHGDDMSQWRLAQIERALAALDHGQHHTALGFVERARTPADRISEAERAEAATLERRLELAQLLASLAERRRIR